MIWLEFSTTILPANYSSIERYIRYLYIIFFCRALVSLSIGSVIILTFTTDQVVQGIPLISFVHIYSFNNCRESSFNI